MTRHELHESGILLREIGAIRGKGFCFFPPCAFFSGAGFRRPATGDYFLDFSAANPIHSNGRIFQGIYS
jgi:hypothetical protein